MKKFHVATDRPIGLRCRAWAREHHPSSWVYSEDMDDCDVFISVMYAKLVSEEYIGKRRCFNFHPGILPRYRGSGAFSWAIINSEEESGITLHELDVDIDHGPIIDIKRVPITRDDTAGSLFQRAEEQLYFMFQSWLPDLLHGHYTATPQDESRARVYYRRDLERMKDLTKYVRAFTFEGKERAFYYKGGKKVYLEL